MDDHWHEIHEVRKEQYALEDCWRALKTKQQEGKKSESNIEVGSMGTIDFT